MAHDQQARQDQQDQRQDQQDQGQGQPVAAQQPPERPDDDNVDGLKGKKPEELTPEELRLMADTMPGEGPGD
ncbi:hypothetical protein [Massilia sp. GCM10023247]|uniref:hypothetical protein n=1 Tax=Massilia sp. GCM10023247 TaxID=3252643 RepID=UPI00360A75DE